MVTYSVALLGIPNQVLTPINQNLTHQPIHRTELFHDPDSFVQANKQSPFSLLMVDFSMLQPIRHHHPGCLDTLRHRTIVLTGTPEESRFARNEGMTYHLHKPIDPNEMIRLMFQLLLENQREKMNREAEQHLITGFNKQGQSFRKLALADMKKVHFVELDEVVAFRAEGNYTSVTMRDGKTYTTSKTLMHYERLLQAYGFIRVHRSFLVHGKYIKQLIRAENVLVMENGMSVEIATEKKSQVLQQISLTG